MRTKARKHVGAHSARPNTSLRRDVQEAIDRIWPDGIVEISFDPDESYFVEIHSKLSRALRRIRNTDLVYEREADGGPVWWEESDPDEDPPDEIERSRSYHTFFISPDGEGFTFETETDGVTEPEFMTDDFAEAGWGEEPPVSRISGSGRTGWVVAVSLLAPFAVIELGDMVTFEGGSTTEPEIESYGQTADGELIDPEKNFREVYGARASKTIVSLRAKIADILERFGIAVAASGRRRLLLMPPPVPSQPAARRFTFLGAEVYRDVESAALVSGWPCEYAGHAPRRPRSSERPLESATAQT